MAQICITATFLQACKLQGTNGKEDLPQQIVPVSPEILRVDEKNGSDAQQGLDISIKEYSIHVTESSSLSLLAEVLKVVRHLQGYFRLLKFACITPIHGTGSKRWWNFFCVSCESIQRDSGLPLLSALVITIHQ